MRGSVRVCRLLSGRIRSRQVERGFIGCRSDSYYTAVFWDDDICIDS